MSDAKHIYSCSVDCLPVYHSIGEIFYKTMSKEDYVLLAETNDSKSDVIGFIVSTIKGTNCHITSFGVDEQFRRFGIGTKIIKYLVDLCQKDKLQDITLFVHVENGSGIKFYERYGFTQEKLVKDYYKGCLTDVKSVDAYFMRLKIEN
jgi:ribosomal protein S18 acetylase RimI-like enzyme